MFNKAETDIDNTWKKENYPIKAASSGEHISFPFFDCCR